MDNVATNILAKVQPDELLVFKLVFLSPKLQVISCSISLHFLQFIAARFNFFSIAYKPF